MLYKIPNNNGKIRTRIVEKSTRNPRTIERMKDKATVSLKTTYILPMVIALSGLFIASSFRSVNLFKPYMPNVIKKVNIGVYILKILYNNPEKITLREPLIAKKIDVDIRKDITL